ncbi:MAG: glycosyltransferase family 39 protein [Candidatus Korobacteraceae bacterium]|jgi:mannosyltransferase
MAVVQSRQLSSGKTSSVDFQGLRRTAVWLTSLTLGAALLRLLYLTGESLTADEGFSVFLARTTAVNFRHILWRGEFNMALYYGALRLWMHLGRGEFLVRLLSVLFATATVPVIYFLGVRLFKRSTALIACLLLAIHPAHLMLSQRARSYPLVMLLVALSSLLFLRLLQEPTWVNWAGYAVLSAAAVYSHFFAVLIIFAQWLSLIFLAPRSLPRRALLTSLVLMLTLLVPAGVFLLQARDGGQVAWVTDLNRHQVLSVLYSLTLSKGASLLYILLWVAAIWRAFQPQPADRTWSYWFVMAWLFIPPAITVAVSVVKPLLMARFLAVCIPAAVLLAAAGLSQLARWSRPAAGVMLLLILLQSASGIRFIYRQIRFAEDWRGATAYLLSGSKAVIWW